MARMLRWLLLLTVVVAAAAVVVNADGWLPSFGQKTSEDKAKEAATQTVEGSKSWTNWAAENIPYFSSSAAKQTNDQLDASKDQAQYAAEEGTKNTRSAADAAKEMAAKGLERMTSTKDQFHGATTGFIQRWGSWAKDNVGKYYSYGPLTKKATDQATDKAADVVKNAASGVDAVADSTKKNGVAAEEEVARVADEKEL